VFEDLSAASLSRQQFHEYVEAPASDAGMGARTSILVVVPEEWELPPQAAEMKIVRAAPSRASDVS